MISKNPKELFEEAKILIVENKLHFLEDVIALLPCSKPTLYKHIPIDSNEFYELKQLLDNNAINVKRNLRKKWEDNDNPTLQISLYKLLGSDDERRKLSQAYNDINIGGEMKVDAELSAKDIKKIIEGL